MGLDGHRWTHRHTRLTTRLPTSDRTSGDTKTTVNVQLPRPPPSEPAPYGLCGNAMVEDQIA